MSFKKELALSLSVMLFIATAHAQPLRRQIKTEEYKKLQNKLATGWNTWYNNNSLTHALLPEGFAINLCLATKDNKAFLREAFKASEINNRPEKVLLGLRSDDGSYTSLQLQYMGMELSVESAAEGNDEMILITPSKPSENYLIAEASLLWNKEGSVGAANEMLTGNFPGKAIEVHSTVKPITNGYAWSTSPHLTFLLKQQIALYTGSTKTLDDIKKIIADHRKQQQARVDAYGDLSEGFKAMQTILAWNTIYDAGNKRVITPVSRLWNQGWGGYVLFDWDTYFASYMLSLFNKELAYANAVEITKAITPDGFIPNFESASGYQGASGETNIAGSSWDRSQPSVGSTMILNIYNKYKEKWFLNEVYDELLTWNRWWPKNRDVNGYLCWGSYHAGDTEDNSESFMQRAQYESGLDNSPMYDSVPFNYKTHTMQLADVGLMSFYVMDCNSLAEISNILGKKTEAEELKKRAAYYTKQLATLWDEQKGIFLNKRLDNGKSSYRLSPTNFYPMLAKACTQKQAERMIKEHYYNPEEFYGEYVLPSIARNDPAFKDNSYWRGRIWAPMNFLVYLGMQNYDLKDARADLIKKSGNLLMKSWKENGGVFENYNSVTGQGNDVGNADGFYHWGALLTFMAFIEKGYMK